MRGFRGGVGFGAMMAGVLSFMTKGMPDFFAQSAMARETPFRKHRAMRTIKRRPARVHRGWTPYYFEVAGPNSQEAERRRRQIEAGSLTIANGLTGD